MPLEFEAFVAQATTLPLPGRVQFRGLDENKSLAELGVLFVQRRDDCNLMRSPRRVGSSAVDLPAGDYGIVYRDQKVVRTCGIKVRSGETTTVAWPFW